MSLRDVRSQGLGRITAIIAAMMIALATMFTFTSMPQQALAVLTGENGGFCVLFHAYLMSRIGAEFTNSDDFEGTGARGTAARGRVNSSLNGSHKRIPLFLRRVNRNVFTKISIANCAF